MKGALCVVALMLAVALPRAPAFGFDRVAVQSAHAEAASDPFLVRGLRPLLNDEDRRLYRETFALQAKGAWGEAEKRIARLNDRILMGHLLAQRYLHPTSYRSKFSELAAWLDRYPDHPQAARIFRLAKKRRTQGARAPRAPERVSMRLVAPPDGEPYPSSKQLSETERGQAKALKRKVRRDVRRTRFSVTERLLNGPEARRLLDQVEIDEGFAQVAAGWLYYGDPEQAYALASRAADRSGRDAPHAQWVAGLSAWRLGRLEQAAGYFGTLAQSRRASVWTASAGAYWAARSYLRLRRPAEMSRWLALAAANPRTFYGLLARGALGMDIDFPDQAESLTQSQAELLMAHAPSRRALALLEAGQRGRAESELERQDGDGDSALAAALVAFDEAAGFPALALRLAGSLADDPGRWTNGGVESGLYPIPPWRPGEGFEIDRALIYAIIRQESRFDPRAESRTGAQGLMQILPSTANYVVRQRRFYGRGRRKLLDPAVNMDIGQRYIAYLLKQQGVEGDLFRLAVAYNGGPGNLLKWLRQMGRIDDPLLFIESIPSLETRLFIERVIANFWIYRARLGQPLPSLDAIAAGDSPTYISLDRPTQTAARP